MTKDKKRILSGVQPTGKLHLGNYFGAVRQHIALQDEGECFYFIAAGSLIYRSNLVPVGEDQVQHLEMTRDMAGKFNRAYGDIFPLPDARLVKHGAKVPGTDGQKMSKSYNNTIEIFAEGKPLKKSVMGIVTDSTPVEAPKDPDKDTVFALYGLFATEEERVALAARYRAGGMGYGEARQM